jgi:hypothetical protein
MATTPNAARLQKLLGGTTISVPGGTIATLSSTTANITTANVTTANLTTVSGSTDTITNQAAVNNFAGCGDTADNAGATGESQIVGVYHGSTSRGFYIYQEEVSTVGTHNATNEAVVCELSKTLPANAKIVEASLVGEDRSNLTECALAIKLSATSGTAQGTAVATSTEVLGAAQGSGALQNGSDGTDGDAEVNVSAIDVGVKTSVYVAAADTGNSVGVSNAGSVIVTIKYYGSAAPASS